jgi:hypothetical protein
LERALSDQIVEDAVDAAEIRRAAGRFRARALAVDGGLSHTSLRVAIGGRADPAGVGHEQQKAQGKTESDPHLEPPAMASHVAQKFLRSTKGRCRSAGYHRRGGFRLSRNQLRNFSGIGGISLILHALLSAAQEESLCNTAGSSSQRPETVVSTSDVGVLPTRRAGRRPELLADALQWSAPATHPMADCVATETIHDAPRPARRNASEA